MKYLDLTGLTTFKNKIVNLIPTKTSDIVNDSNYVADGSYVHTDNNLTDDFVQRLSNIGLDSTDITLTSEMFILTDGIYRCTITNAKITEDSSVLVNISKESMEIAKDAEIQPYVESYDGYAVIESNKLPTDDILASYIIIGATFFSQNIETYINEKIAEIEPTGKEITLLSSDWVLNEETGLYEYTIVDSSITSNHIINCYMDLENQEKISEGYTETYNGSYKFIVTEAPTEDVTMNITIQLTKVGES